ncbi:MAG: hypothetical protein KAI79_02405 [Bacteroidales bacterium]|nr:hypothetical protein [Bacteroidales bacterium]
MIAEITKQYSKQALLNAEKHNNIYDCFDDLISKIEVISFIEHEGQRDLNHGIYMYIEDIKEHVKGLELQLKREILEGTLKV